MTINKVHLNKYLALAGLGARRKVVALIEEGKVTVNGKIITDPGYKIGDGDVVTCNSAPVAPQEKVYILMNKPKGYVTTVADEQNRKTVMDLLGDRCPVRVYPVGRLDRDTTGLLLLTNDGEFAQLMAHPKHGIRKIYHVTLDNLLQHFHEEKIKKGVMLDDGLAQVDKLVLLEGSHRRMVSVTLHCGRYRIVRRIFEHFGYQIKNLDRPLYGGLTKTGLKPGSWRFLTDSEIKHLTDLALSDAPVKISKRSKPSLE